MHSADLKTPKAGKKLGNLSKIAFGAFLLVGLTGTAIAQNMVVRSTGPSAKSYPAGKKLSNNAKLTLKKLDQVTILGKGGTRVLKGPGTFSVNRNGARQSSSSTRLSSFINNRGSSRARTGAVRSAGVTDTTVAPKNPNLWYLDVTKGGKFCVSDANTLVLWRPDYTGSATASIVEPTNGTVTEVAWRKGNPLKSWPKTEAPLTNGASYRLIGSNVEKSVEVNFVMLNDAPKSLDEAATVLIANGCQSQLDLLVETLDDGSSESQEQS
ncbi:hypothetical protein [Parasphingorhabdus cellanae]|uniref:Uncharacterized protein n=1 Tax=Parasphingorhabdus cellanae TaxID=2806553 RepID=A0ABX7T5H8_9SPHN|nr:hypothetical protein [Parasphingorhabdus cellanae]QTD55500.1 hypothetical protein J4G78_15025 [Parasphingorhabdus cellanae]